MNFSISEVDKVEILTLQDNYVDLVSRDDTEMMIRARPVKDMEVKNSILAEHGFSALVTVTRGDISRSILFDFGFSEQGAALNAEALNADLSSVEALVLSHGHPDHRGGLMEIARRVNKNGIELVLHPAAFKKARYMKTVDGMKVYFPFFEKEKLQDANIIVREADKPYPLLDGAILFMGQVPMKTDFEKGVPYLFYEQSGEEKRDPIEDDSAIIARVKGKGLVVLSGCAHAGIVNTVKYARELTGVNKVFVVMGGFHLSGPDFKPIIEPTTQAIQDMDPQYIVPTHCTGRKAIMHIENEMPDKFLLNMSGTKLIFSA